MPTRLPTLPVEWENLVLAVCVHLGLPLLPILVEWGSSGEVTPSSLILTASIFIITIGVSSRSRAFFGATLIGCIFFAAQYGSAAVAARYGANAPAGTLLAVRLAPWVIAIVLFLHLVERYHRHVVDREGVFAFMKD